MVLRLVWSILGHNDCVPDRMNCLPFICCLCKKIYEVWKRRQGQQKIPRVMNTNASDGPGTNSQQVENRREFRDKTKLGQVFKLSARFGHFASEVDSHSWQRLAREQIWSIWGFSFAVLVLSDLWMFLCLGKQSIKRNDSYIFELMAFQNIKTFKDHLKQGQQN